MPIKHVAIVCALSMGQASLASAIGGEEQALSLSESLVLKLATADLTSEPHAFPGRALSSFGQWMSEGTFLKAADRKLWRVTTVRQPGEFEFIHAETEDFAVRQSPWIILLGFEPITAQWRRDLRMTVRDFLRANVQGAWDEVPINSPKDLQGTVFLETPTGLSFFVGTCCDSFIAVVIDNRIWIALPKKRFNDGLTPFSVTLEQNSRWFSTAGRRP
jgi:hypothetical protein